MIRGMISCKKLIINHRSLLEEWEEIMVVAHEKEE